MALSDFGLKIGVWYEATLVSINEDTGTWYNYFISEDNDGLKYISIEYDGESACICREDWSEFLSNITDNSLRKTNRKNVLKKIKLINVFNSIFK